MGLAFRQAEAAAGRDEVPIGAVLVDSTTGQVLAADHNRVEELHDPTAHAEMLVIRAVSTGRKEKRLPLCDLYVTLEPCPMCADRDLVRKAQAHHLRRPRPQGRRRGARAEDLPAADLPSPAGGVRRIGRDQERDVAEDVLPEQAVDAHALTASPSVIPALSRDPSIRRTSGCAMDPGSRPG